MVPGSPDSFPSIPKLIVVPGPASGSFFASYISGSLIWGLLAMVIIYARDKHRCKSCQHKWR
jgi:hypothetical protein